MQQWQDVAVVALTGTAVLSGCSSSPDCMAVELQAQPATARGNSATLIAHLTADGSPVAGRELEFYKAPADTSGVEAATARTDAAGTATLTTSLSVLDKSGMQARATRWSVQVPFLQGTGKNLCDASASAPISS